MSWNKKRRYDIELEHIYTLSQKLVSKSEYAHFRDYAMNVNAKQIAVIDFLIKQYESYPKVVEFLKQIRNLVLSLGEAVFISEKADILTHLGLKVGKTGEIEIDGIESN